MNETYPMVPFEGRTGIIQASTGQVLSVSHVDGKNISVNFEEIDVGLKGWLNQFLKIYCIATVVGHLKFNLWYCLPKF